MAPEIDAGEFRAGQRRDWDTASKGWRDWHELIDTRYPRRQRADGRDGDDREWRPGADRSAPASRGTVADCGAGRRAQRAASASVAPPGCSDACSATLRRARGRSSSSRRTRPPWISPRRVSTRRSRAGGNHLPSRTGRRRVSPHARPSSSPGLKMRDQPLWGCAERCAHALDSR